MSIIYRCLTFLLIPAISCLFRELVLKKNDKVKLKYAGEATSAENTLCEYLIFVFVNNLLALLFLGTFFHKTATLAERFESVVFVCKYSGLAVAIAVMTPLLELLCKPALAAARNRMNVHAIRSGIGGFFDSNFRFSFITAFILMFLTHGFAFVNVMYSHDSLSFGYAEGRMKSLIRLGKWACHFYAKYFRLSYAAPFLVGVLSAFFVAVSVSLVTRLFRLNRLEAVATAVIMTTNLALAATYATYIQNGDEYGLALLFACLAVYTREKAPAVWNVLLPVVFVTLCAGTYAAYVDCAIGLFIFKMIYDIINGKESFFKHIAHGLVDVAVLLAGTLLDLRLVRFFNDFYGFTVSHDANGPGRLEQLSLETLSDWFQPMLNDFWEYFFKASAYNTDAFMNVNRVFAALIVVATVIAVFKLRKNVGKMILLLLLLAVLPIALSAIFLLAFGEVHWLMIYSYELAYILPIVMLGNAGAGGANRLGSMQKFLGAIACVCCLLVGYYNFSYANGMYTFKKLVYDNTYENMQTIWEDINSFSEYVPEESTVVIMGYMEDSKIVYDSEISDKYIKCFTGAEGTSATYAGAINNFFSKVLGKPTSLVFNIEEIEASAEYQQMPIYPQTGYIRWIGDKLVVKISY